MTVILAGRDLIAHLSQPYGAIRVEAASAGRAGLPRSGAA
jgi:hypothetical protein